MTHAQEATKKLHGAVLLPGCLVSTHGISVLLQACAEAAAMVRPLWGFGWQGFPRRAWLRVQVISNSRISCTR